MTKEEFYIDKLTVFEVVVKDANAMDLERSCDELRKNLANHGEKFNEQLKLLIFSIEWSELSSNDILLRVNSARTPQELRTYFYE